jgi:Niemann-Pick C1 protein
MIFFAVFIIIAYTIIVLSSCSPIHLRIWLAIAGMLTIVISYIGCYSICGLAGWNTGGIHQLLAFVLLCIGVDDVFVIVNALDQTDFNLSLEKRF